jgi:hypothetical protein
VFEDLPDVAIDQPIAPKRLGEVLGSLVASGTLLHSYISSAGTDELRTQVFAIANKQIS